LIKKNFHDRRLLRGFETTLGVIENGIDLVPGDSRKPFQEFLNCRAALDILEQRLYRDARVLEKPGAADLSRNSLYCSAF
jgi:hypothetical protein